MNDATQPAPRFVLQFQPDGNKQSFQLTAFADNVTCNEVVQHMLALAGHFATTPLARFATVSEVQASQKEAEYVKAHPAQRLFARSGEQLWLSEDALLTVDAGELDEEGNGHRVKDALHLNGWVDAGPAPEGSRKGCAYWRDPAAFALSYLVPAPARSANVIELAAVPKKLPTPTKGKPRAPTK